MRVIALPRQAPGCDECRSLHFQASSSRGDAADARRKLVKRANHTDARDRAEEMRTRRAEADAKTEAYLAHHAEVHPIVVTLPGTDNDRAPSHRKPTVPKAAVLAERIRAGETLEQVAESLGRTAAGQPRNRRDEDGLVIPARPWDFPPWFDDALCAQTDPESFFPEKGGSTAEAKRVCEACPVRLKCLQYAIDNHERFGVWGGLSERERRQIAKAAS